MTEDPNQVPVEVARIPELRRLDTTVAWLDENQLASARIGDVLALGTEQPVPAGWHVLDGSAQNSRAWPEFAEHHQIEDPIFILPESRRSLIIKLASKPAQGEDEREDDRVSSIPMSMML